MGHNQQSLLETDVVRSLLDKLLADSKLYTQSKDYLELMRFVVRLRNFAPFNAMLLQIQKPGLSYAASALDWKECFGKYPKQGARPLIILWPFGPVAFVYDVMDTEGKDLPKDVNAFFASGPIEEDQMISFMPLVRKKNIEWDWIDAGDNNAVSIRVVKRAATPKESTQYKMLINRNHAPAVQFTTLAHELGRLFLGHLGPDQRLNVPRRPHMDHAQRELEAESVAYLVCERNGVTSKSETYLRRFVDENTVLGTSDLYQIMRAAGQVETLLGLSMNTTFNKPKGHGPIQEHMVFGKTTGA